MLMVMMMKASMKIPKLSIVYDEALKKLIYALLLYFLISQFTRFFALPHVFSPLPRPADFCPRPAPQKYGPPRTSLVHRQRLLPTLFKHWPVRFNTYTIVLLLLQVLTPLQELTLLQYLLLLILILTADSSSVPFSIHIQW